MMHNHQNRLSPIEYCMQRMNYLEFEMSHFKEHFFKPGDFRISKDQFASNVSPSQKFGLIQKFFEAAVDVNVELNFPPKQTLYDVLAQKRSIRDVVWSNMETEEMNTLIRPEVNFDHQPRILTPNLPPKLNIVFWMMTESSLQGRLMKKNIPYFNYLQSIDDLGPDQSVVFVMNAAGRSLDDKLFEIIQLLSERSSCVFIIKIAPNNLKGAHELGETLRVAGTLVSCQTIFYSPDNKDELLIKLLHALEQLIPEKRSLTRIETETI